MSHPHSILLLGAGELGLSILTSLSTHPSHPPLTVLLRPSTLSSPSPTQRGQLDRITGLGASTLPGDIDSASVTDLSRLFAPFHTVIGCTGMYAPPGTQLKLCRAVLEAKVQRYLPWQFGVDYDVIGRGSSQDLFTEQLDVRDLLRGQEEAKWVIVSTGLFMSFLFWDGFGVVDLGAGKVRALGDWGNEITVTTVEDIGRCVADIACSAPDVNGVVHTSGETITYGRLADVVEHVLGRKVEREVWDVERLRGELELDPANGLKKYRVVFAEGRGVAWEVEGTWNMRRGIELMGVEAWLRGMVEGGKEGRSK